MDRRNRKGIRTMKRMTFKCTVCGNLSTEVTREPPKHCGKYCKIILEVVNIEEGEE